MMLPMTGAQLTVVPGEPMLSWRVPGAVRMGGTVMTSALDTSQSLGLGSGLAALRPKWGWIVALGIVYIIAGFIALGSIVMATVASVLVVGAMMIVAGVTEVIGAFQMKSWGKFLIWAL